MKKILLLSLPFGALDRPALGLSLLKARLTELGVDCDIRYLNFAFAELVGYETYQWLMSELPYTAFVGDWLFTAALYGEEPIAEQGYIREVLRETWQLDDLAISHIRCIRRLVPHFLTYCLTTIPWQEYALVGFTSTFTQNLASLALAQRLKATYPELKIAFGGANWEGEMGQELHQQFSFIDYVCSGEADESFPLLVQRLLAGQAIDDPDQPSPGLTYWANGQLRYTGQAQLIRCLDQLPIPDFSDYFETLNQSTIAASIMPVLLLETSRGCWWGAKSHCTFCGLNGGTIAFRSKSADRVRHELTSLVNRWQIDFVEVVDNILDMRYFDDLLPSLVNAGQPARLFFEVKANLSRSQVKLLQAAGVYRIQPGIESLSDHILKLMRKGVTALRNIQLLKWCKEYNLAVDWNILYSFPGETQADYEAILELLPAIRFLGPPSACGPVRLDRFSPYYNAPADFGLRNVRPMIPYKYLYPFDTTSLSRIAYYFDYDYEPGCDPTGYAAPVITYVEAWRRQPEWGSLISVVRSNSALCLIDTRSDATQPEFILSGLERAAYDYCDELRSGMSVARHLHQLFPDVEFTEQQVLNFLDSLVANRLMVSDGIHYLSLAIPAQPVSPAGEILKITTA